MDKSINSCNKNEAQGTTISRRKNDHIAICLSEDVNFRKSNGFQRFGLQHKALPELDLTDIDISTSFLGKNFSLPFFIEALTGGSSTAWEINQNLARAAEVLKIGMGVGSQRAMLANPGLAGTYQIRSVAPDILLLGNIGATQLKSLSQNDIAMMVNSIKADGLVIHLNAAQEICQPEGDTDWRNVLSNIERVCSQAPFPVVVKETGCGIDGETAFRLASVGVACIDVAGAGGTSFTKVENCRRIHQSPVQFSGQVLEEWGISTADSLVQCRAATDLPLIASGGMRTGLDCAKAFAMGASLVGFARPLLRTAVRSHRHVVAYLSAMGEELKRVMFLIGAKDLADFRNITLLTGDGNQPADHSF